MDIVIMRLMIGFGASLIFGIIAFMMEMVDDRGFFAGTMLFTLVYVFLDWQAYVIIVVFFTMTGLAISIENKDKANKGEFELYKAKRPIERVLGRSLAGVIFAGLFFVTERPEFKLAFVASYAEAIFDTISTKLGKLLNPDAILINNFKKVRHGTPGGISIAGTLCGILAALILGIVGFVSGLFANNNSVYLVLIAAGTGASVDSFLNAVSYQKKHIPNEFINFFSSAIAGIICVWIHWIFNIIIGFNIRYY